MKLTSVELHPENSSEVVTLSFRDPRGLNAYQVKGITGLDADEIIPRSYGGSGGLKFNTLSLVKRDVVIQIGLSPNFIDRKSYSDLRDTLYRMIASSRTGKVQIQFKNEVEVVAAVSGHISKFEASLFEKAQEVQLTVTCDDPSLRALEPIIITDLDAVTSMIDDDKSNAPHGFSFFVGILGDIDDITISDPDDDSWAFQVTPDGGFLTDDIFYLSSEYNDKQLYIIRDGDTIHLADVISFGSVWPIMFPGENTFAFTNPDSLDWTIVSYYPTYWGV